ncbi:MarR family winged helix-turn-helix transcriptional regulator [Methylobacterium sp. CM6257]
MNGMPRSEQSSVSLVASMRRAHDLIRRALGATDLPAAWIAILLLVAEKEAQTIGWLEKESGLSLSTVQRTLLALGKSDRYGRPGLDLVESIADPRHGSRKIHFLTRKGRDLMSEVVAILARDPHSKLDVRTASEYMASFERERADKPQRIDIKAFSPQVVATGKRSIQRKYNEKVGSHIVAFPYAPAKSIIDAISDWVDDHKGKIYILDNVAKPDGMVIVDLPDEHEQFHFVLMWRGAVEG